MDNVPNWEFGALTQARDFAKAMGYLAKTDAIDARVLAQLAQVIRERIRARGLTQVQAAELERRWPQIDFGPITWAIHEPRSGFLMAFHAVQAVVQFGMAEGVEYVPEAAAPRLGGSVAGVPVRLPAAADAFNAGAHYVLALCREAGFTGPLYQCSIYGNKQAGEKLKAMLAMGSSEPWPAALKAMTGEDKMDATAIIDYFAPLKSWLDEQNRNK